MRSFGSICRFFAGTVETEATGTVYTDPSRKYKCLCKLKCQFRLTHSSFLHIYVDMHTFTGTIGSTIITCKGKEIDTLTFIEADIEYIDLFYNFICVRTYASMNI